MLGIAKFFAFMSGVGATMQPWFQDTLVARDLEIRQGTARCDPKGYTSHNGLGFTTYCNQDNPSNDAQSPFTTATMAECMEYCSRFWGDAEGCFGVVWIQDQRTCYLRNSSTGTTTLRPQANTHAALVVDSQMKGFDTKCPAPDASTHDLPGVPGIGYTMNCGKVIDGFDTCFSGFSNACFDMPYRGFFHTKTMEECIHICVDQHPLCKGVSWSPDLKIGFANCWPKTGFMDSKLQSPPKNAGVLHSATITRIDPVDNQCPVDKTYATGSGAAKKTFNIQCGRASSGSNMTSLHMQNIASCMDACATSTQRCVGVVFDSSLGSGFNNCYLQNTTNTLSDHSFAMYAALSSGVRGASTSDSGILSDDSSSSSSGAWIAAPVIGGIAALASIAFLAFWVRRRKAQAAYNASTVEKKLKYESSTYGPTPMHSDGSSVTSNPKGAFEYSSVSPIDHKPSPVVLPTELAGENALAGELPRIIRIKYARRQTGKFSAPEAGKTEIHELP